MKKSKYYLMDKIETNISAVSAIEIEKIEEEKECGKWCPDCPLDNK
jgi:hypothetical protein